MKTALKIVLAIVGVVIVVIVALGIYLSVFFNPNDYKAQIAQAVEQKTGRQVKIPGDIELSVFPWLGLELGQVELENAKGFGDKPFASIQSAAARIKVLPLLHKQVELGSLTLQGLTLRLARNKQGHSNWEDMVENPSGKSAGKQAPAPAPQPTGGESNGFQLSSLQVAGVEVKDAQVFWDDATTDTHYHLQNFTLRTGKVQLGQPFMLNSSFKLESAKPAFSADVKLVSQVTADLRQQTYALDDLHLTVVAAGEAVPGGKQQIDLTGGAHANLKAQTANVRDLVLEMAGLTVHAQLSGEKIVDQPQLKGTLKVDEFSPRDVFAKLKMAVPPTQDSEVLSKASLDSEFTATADQANLKKLNIVLDDTHLTGTASMSHFSQPAIRFDLAVDGIDADRYMPPPSKGDEAKAEPVKNSAQSSGKGGSSDATPISLDALKTLNLAGKLSIGKLKAMGLRMQNASVQVTARDGVLKVEPLTANMYNGKITSTATIKAAGKQSYALTANISGVQAGPLLKDMMDKELVDGTGNLKLNLQSTGQTVGAVRQGLGGTVNFAFRNGALHGFNLAEIVRNAKARLSGGKVEHDAPQKTDFSALTGSGQVHQGILKNDDLQLKSPLFRVNGAGKVNLVKNTLDYLVKVTVVDTLKGQGGAELASLKGVTVPIRLSGDLSSPSYRPDLAAALAGSQKERVDEAKEKAKQRIEEKKQDLRDKAKDKLKNLFN